MASSTAGVRNLVRTAIEALSGWTESRHAPSLFGRDTDQMVHQSFAVAALESTPDEDDRRQVMAHGIVTVTPLTIRWAYRLRGDAQNADYSLALDAEQTVVIAVMAITSSTVRPSWVLRRVTRDDSREGWVLGSIAVDALHRYGLTL